MVRRAKPPNSGFHSAVLTNGEMAAFYNGVAFVSAFAMVPLARRIRPGTVHAICLALGGLGMLAIPEVSTKAMLFLPAAGIGFAWGSIMGNPYVILAGSIPPERTGVYMGIFNMMIVIPMILIALTLPLIYGGAPASLWGLFTIPTLVDALHGNSRNVLRLAGGMMLCASVAVLWVREGRASALHSAPVAA